MTVRAKKPVCGGDWVTTTSGVYGYVDEFTRDDRGRVVLEFDPGDDQADPVEHRIPVSECVPVQGLCGWREACEAVEDNAACWRWAVRSVTVAPVETAAGGAERRAVCWKHLPAAVFWADHRFGVGRGQVAIGPVEGGSCETPFAFDAVQFGGQWCISSPSTATRWVEAVVMSLGCDCPAVHYASPVRCDDHEARRAAVWADIDGRLADRFLDVMLPAKHLNAAPGAVHRFVKVRRAPGELAGEPTLPDDRLDVIHELLELDPVHAVLYERVAGRITYELAAGMDLGSLSRVQVDCDPDFDLYPQIPWAGRTYCCAGWFE